MVGDLLTWNSIFQIFRPAFIFGLGIGLIPFLLGYGLKFIFAFIEEIV